MLFSPLTYAETCVNDYGGNNSCVEGRTYGETAGDCTKLGYTATSCNGKAFLKCPFDKTKLRCIEKNQIIEKINCEELGYLATQPSCDENGFIMTCTEDEKTFYKCINAISYNCQEYFSASMVTMNNNWCKTAVSCDENSRKLCAEINTTTTDTYNNLQEDLKNLPPNKF